MADRKLALEVCLEAVGGGMLFAFVRDPFSGTKNALGLLNSALMGVLARFWLRSARGGASGKAGASLTGKTGGGGAIGGGGSDMTGGWDLSTEAIERIEKTGDLGA
jgi:hypothetical protein